MPRGDDLEWLRRGTRDRDLAINWHKYRVPAVERRIRELGEIATDLRRADGDFTALIAEFDQEVAEATAVLEAFVARWPRPAVETLADRHEPRSIPKAWQALPLSPSLPGKPLVLRSPNPKGHLLYWQAEDGAVFRVPNMHYNRLGGRTATRWAF